VLFVKPRYWVVVDDLLGAAEHTVAVRFQLAPTAVMVDATQWARVGPLGEPGLLIRSFSESMLKCDIHEGELAPIEGWVSTGYGQRCPAPVLVYSTIARLPLRVISLLIPVKRVSEPAPEVAPVTGEDAHLVGLRFDLEGEVVRFDGCGFSVERR